MLGAIMQPRIRPRLLARVAIALVIAVGAVGLRDVGAHGPGGWGEAWSFQGNDHDVYAHGYFSAYGADKSLKVFLEAETPASRLTLSAQSSSPWKVTRVPHHFNKGFTVEQVIVPVGTKYWVVGNLPVSFKRSDLNRPSLRLTFRLRGPKPARICIRVGAIAGPITDDPSQPGLLTHTFCASGTNWAHWTVE